MVLKPETLLSKNNGTIKKWPKEKYYPCDAINSPTIPGTIFNKSSWRSGQTQFHYMSCPYKFKIEAEVNNHCDYFEIKCNQND